MLQNLFLAASIWAGSWWVENNFVQLLFSPLLAVFIFRNFSIMHEASHDLISRNKKLNEFIGTLSGALCFLPYTAWKRSHLDHHYWSGNIERDPVMGFLQTYPKMSPRAKTILDIIWKSWFPVLAIIQNIVFWFLAAKITQKNNYSFKYLISLVTPSLIWLPIFFMTPFKFTFLVLAPGLLIYFVMVEVVNLPHHLQRPYHRGEVKLPPWDQFQTARTCLYPQWIATHITLNFNYHIEHHMFTDCPWYQLPDVAKVVQSQLGESYEADPYLKWIIANKKISIQDVLFGQPQTDVEMTIKKIAS